MIKKLWIAGIVLLLILSLTACISRKVNESEQPEGLSFSKLKDMEEITVEGNTVTVVLSQNGSLPYRWGITRQSECATLTQEYEAEDPYDFSIASGGSSPEYHVFVFELKESDVAELEFYNRWVVEPENLNEANGYRMFCLEYSDGQWKVE